VHVHHSWDSLTGAALAGSLQVTAPSGSGGSLKPVIPDIDSFTESFSSSQRDSAAPVTRVLLAFSRVSLWTLL